MRATDEMGQLPTLDELRSELDALKQRISEMTPPSLGKAVDKIQERPVTLALAGLAIGLVAGCVLMRSLTR